VPRPAARKLKLPDPGAVGTNAGVVRFALALAVHFLPIAYLAATGEVFVYAVLVRLLDI